MRARRRRAGGHRRRPGRRADVSLAPTGQHGGGRPTTIARPVDLEPATTTPRPRRRRRDPADDRARRAAPTAAPTTTTPAGSSRQRHRAAVERTGTASSRSPSPRSGGRITDVRDGLPQRDRRPVRPDRRRGHPVAAPGGPRRPERQHRRRLRRHLHQPGLRPVGAVGPRPVGLRDPGARGGHGHGGVVHRRRARESPRRPVWLAVAEAPRGPPPGRRGLQHLEADSPLNRLRRGELRLSRRPRTRSERCCCCCALGPGAVRPAGSTRGPCRAVSTRPAWSRAGPPPGPSTSCDRPACPRRWSAPAATSPRSAIPSGDPGRPWRVGDHPPVGPSRPGRGRGGGRRAARSAPPAPTQRGAHLLRPEHRRPGGPHRLGHRDRSRPGPGRRPRDRPRSRRRRRPGRHRRAGRLRGLADPAGRIGRGNGRVAVRIGGAAAAAAA